MKKNFSSSKELELIPPTSVQRSRSAVRGSVFTIVNTLKCGRRIEIANELKQTIGDSISVQIAFDTEGIFIGKNLGIDSNSQLTLRKIGKKSVIYSSPLVQEITERFKLDFSNKTSTSYKDISLLDINGITAAYIYLLHPDSDAEAELMVDNNKSNRIQDMEPEEEADVGSEDAELDLDDGADSDFEDAELDLDDEADSGFEDAELDLDDENDNCRLEPRDWNEQDSDFDENSDRRLLLTNKHRRSRSA
ncbi:hypothetical protein D3C74_181410 [compost metagenome]